MLLTKTTTGTSGRSGMEDEEQVHRRVLVTGPCKQYRAIKTRGILPVNCVVATDPEKNLYRRGGVTHKKIFIMFILFYF